ncbi:MCE family protein [Aldersonia sp. NBC_00410]|uniref:MCE family protein n=1 Tax=Aldersonia sp. NBC_00410 TaxID=2975954 RepID=UPI0022594EC2|nr:MCE family protein [Aldersonia sp. NBC_00410]MCX5044278.1 MCE family protein [Aldersonia sp. NBC_00410]
MRRNAMLIKFSAFAVVMLILSAFLVLVFSQYRSGSTTSYSAIFADSSGLKSGDTVRVAGIRVGTVKGVQLRDDKTVKVTFDADDTLALTDGTKIAARYLNLVGDRYLEVVDAPGSTHVLKAGSEVPLDHTEPALDLDLLLGGFKPVIQGLKPQEVNALTASLVQILQGQEDTAGSLLNKTASFTSALGNNSQTIEQLIDNLKTVMETLSRNGDEFSATVDKLGALVDQLAAERDPIGAAIVSLDKGTATIADLLTQARPSLNGSIENLQVAATNIDNDLPTLDKALSVAPENFRKMARTGAYGGFIQYWICGVTVRVSDPNGGVIVLPWIRQTTGRCADS